MVGSTSRTKEQYVFGIVGAQYGDICEERLAVWASVRILKRFDAGAGRVARRQEFRPRFTVIGRELCHVSAVVERLAITSSPHNLEFIQ